MSNDVFWLVTIICCLATGVFVLWPVRSILFATSKARLKTGIHPNLLGKHGKAFERAFVECIDGCKCFIKAVAGECSTHAYTEAVGQALTRAIEDRRVKVYFVCGPILLYRDSGGDKRSPILDLAAEKKLDLYYSDTRMAHHYRIGDPQHHVYWESPHDLVAPERQYFDWENNRYENEVKLREFEKLLASGKVKKSTNPKEDFVLVEHDTQLQKLIDLAKLRGRVLEEMNGSEIRKLKGELEGGLA